MIGRMVYDNRVDFAFFESLTFSEAHEFLESYRREGEAHMDDLCCALGVQDAERFQVHTLPTAFKVIAQTAVFEPASHGEPEPDWVRRSPSWGDGPTELDDASKVQVLRLSYYLGETLRRMWGDPVGWTVGDSTTAEQQQPVLSGFVNCVELAPLLITENLVRRIAETPEAAGDLIDTTLATWTRLLRR